MSIPHGEVEKAQASESDQLDSKTHLFLPSGVILDKPVTFSYLVFLHTHKINGDHAKPKGLRIRRKKGMSVVLQVWPLDHLLSEM